MPTYEYACAKCGERFDVYQSFSDEPLKKHEGCGGKLTKVFGPVGIVLKGSGFYKTDNRSSSKAGKSSDGGSAGDSGSGDSGSGSGAKESTSSSDSGSGGSKDKPAVKKADSTKKTAAKPAAGSK